MISKFTEFSKQGDQGFTSLFSGERVPKYDPRPEAYGTIDEANSAIGLARAFCKDRRVKRLLFTIQEELFVVAAEMAMSPEAARRLKRIIGPKDLERLEKITRDLLKKTDIARSFIVPGSTVESASLDLARTILRRAERRAHRLRHKGMITNDDVPRYLNRLADLLFTLGRYIERRRKRGFELYISEGRKSSSRS